MGSEFNTVNPDDLVRDLFLNLDKYMDEHATAAPIASTTPPPVSITANTSSECPHEWWTPSYYQCDQGKTIGLYYVCVVLIILIIIGIVVLLLVCCCYACSMGVKEATWQPMPPTQPVIVENHHHHHHGVPQITVTSAHSVPSAAKYRPPQSP